MSNEWEGFFVVVVVGLFILLGVMAPLQKYWDYHEDLKQKGFVMIVEPPRTILVPIDNDKIHIDNRCR